VVATTLTNKGLFKPKVMYFELCNLLETFQRMMNSIFRKLLHKEVLTNYMDNFVILAKTKKEVEKIFILEVVVGQEEVQMENDKIKAAKE